MTSKASLAMKAQRQQLERAVELLRARQYDKAALALLSILKRWPGQADALHFMGLLRHAQGDSEAAIRLIMQAIQGMPEQPGPWNNLGNVLVETQRYADAETAYQRCLALQPDFAEALCNLSTILRKRHEYAEAEALCRRAIAAQANFAQAWYNLSLVLVAQGRIAEGLDAQSQAVLLRPRHLQARNSVIKALIRVGRQDEAAALYRQWLAEDPDNAVVRHHLAACSGESAPERASDAYVEQTFDAFAATFDAHLAALDYRAPELVTGLLSELLPPPERQFDIADLGCGTGLCGPHLRAWARSLVGCDLSSGMLQRAQRIGAYDQLQHLELVAFLRQNLAGFDALVCADTLCYFGALAAAAEAALAALRPGGWFIFTVEALPEPEQANYALQAHGRYAHARAYIAQTLSASGFTGVSLRSESLRQEGGQPVMGWLVAAQAPG